MPNSRSAQARINGAKSRSPKTKEGLQRWQAAATKHGAYAVNTAVLPTESAEAYAELRRAIHAYWAPQSLYEARKVEQLVQYNWEADRIQMSRHDQLLLAMADVCRHDPAITTPETLNSRTETRIAVPGGSFERQDLASAASTSKPPASNATSYASKNTPPPAEGPKCCWKQRSTAHRVPPPSSPCRRDPQPTTLEQRTHIVREIGEMPEVPVPQPQDILAWAKANFDFEADEAQQQLLTDQTGRVLMCAGRQTGKSTAAALRVVHEALYKPKMRAASPQELVEFNGPSAGNNGFRLPNGSEVVALPDSLEAVRSFSDPSVVVIDEAAFGSSQHFCPPTERSSCSAPPAAKAASSASGRAKKRPGPPSNSAQPIALALIPTGSNICASNSATNSIARSSTANSSRVQLHACLSDDVETLIFGTNMQK